MHVPKTGGISLRQTLLEAVGERPRFRILHPINDAARLAAMPVARRRSLALVEGHMYHGAHEFIPRTCEYLTLLRDPVPRIRSFFAYVSRESWHPFHATIRQEGLTLADLYARRLTTELDNYMTRSLTSLAYAEVPFGGVTDEMYALAKANLDAMHLVGLTERLADFYALLCSHLGWTLRTPPHLNRTSEPARHTDHATSDEARAEAELILTHNRYDLALYRHAAELLDRRMRSAGLSPMGTPAHAASRGTAAPVS